MLTNWIKKKYIGYLIHHYQNTIFFYSLNFSESVFETRFDEIYQVKAYIV